MKNFLKTGLYFFAFAIAGILFQISCSNSDSENLSPNAQGKLIFTKWNNGTGTIVPSIWTCNYDGTDLAEVPITLPTGVIFNTANGHDEVKLSPDGLKIFFLGFNTTTITKGIYSCNFDGSNVQEVHSYPYNTSEIIDFEVN